MKFNLTLEPESEDVRFIKRVNTFKDAEFKYSVTYPPHDAKDAIADEVLIQECKEKAKAQPFGDTKAYYKLHQHGDYWTYVFGNDDESKTLDADISVVFHNLELIGMKDLKFKINLAPKKTHTFVFEARCLDKEKESYITTKKEYALN